MTITAQKPHSTGSGFYLTEMVKGFAALGHEQAVLAGVYREDTVDFPTGTSVLSGTFLKQKNSHFLLRECRMRCLMKAPYMVR